jgi:hypothetical protein
VKGFGGAGIGDLNTGVGADLVDSVTFELGGTYEPAAKLPPVVFIALSSVA